MPEYRHTPVMLEEVIKYLDPKPGDNFIDCTLGGAGYTIEIAKRVGEKGKVLAFDLDKMAIKNAESQIKNLELQNIILAYDNFKNLQKVVREKFKDENIKFRGIVFDLGLSSAQLADKSRGFSFQLDAPLDMAFGHSRSGADLEQIGADTRILDTEVIVNKWPREKLEKIIREYGEERFAGRIARGIVEARKVKPIATTGQLVKIIESVVPGKYKRGKIYFATRTFQALRIATNRELENLEIALPQAVDLVKIGGKIVVVSFHSLEDRIVKNFFKKESKDCLCPSDIPICQCAHKARLKILTKKVLVPKENEIKNNSRSRSAKMRATIKI